MLADIGRPQLDILIVDDDEQIRYALLSVLTSEGHRVREAFNGTQALEALAIREPDVMILDLGLPDMSGFEVCREARLASDVPILVLTVRDAEDDKIRALDLGADDYLTKPFASGELLARIRAVLRRVNPATDPDKLDFGDLLFDFAQQRVLRDGEKVPLTRTEWQIVSYLARRAGRVVPSQMIIASVWGPDSRTDVQVLRVHMSNARRKLERDTAVPRHIVTEPGVGFRFVE